MITFPYPRTAIINKNPIQIAKAMLAATTCQRLPTMVGIVIRNPK
jgi:hypothetical protein